MAGPEREAAESLRPLGAGAFLAVAIASLGGPLALAALAVPGVLGDAGRASGLVSLAGALLFLAPLTIWLRYARYVGGPGGLFAFVEAAAGRRVAALQGAVWAISYLLYLLYTTIQIVYDLLPLVLPGERRYQSTLALLIPVALSAVMIAGRTAALLVIAAIAAGQMVLAGLLDGVALAHLATPASSFASLPGGMGAFGRGAAQSSLLYICASLPLFLSGELAAPRRTMRRVLPLAVLLTTLVIVLAVAPLAGVPGLLGTAIPGIAVAQQFAPGLATAIGIGVALSTAGVMLCEYLALSRLAHAAVRWRTRRANLAIGAIVVAGAPLTLIDPQGVYAMLLKPSLVALWLSQLVVFAVFPRFCRAHRLGMRSAWLLSSVAGGLAVYGAWSALQQSAS